MFLLEEFFDSALVICKCSNEGKKELVNFFLPELGNLVREESICCALRQEALRTLNSILGSISREERKKFPLSEEMCSLSNDLAKTILEAGDYDLQVALSEALCRLMTKKWRDDLVHHWFEDNYLAEAFKEIKDREFETDCRKFLNQLNERLGNKRRVYSFPCISAFADMNEVKKPSDEKLEKFWIDFNFGSQSVTFYVDSNEGTLWDSVRLSKEAVSHYNLKEVDGEKVVKIYMKIPITLNKIEATKIKISFSAEFEILGILKKVLGDEKMMINVAEEESVHNGKEATQDETVIPESTSSQGSGKDPSNLENVGSLSDNTALQHSQQPTGTVPKDVTRERRNRKTSLAKQGTEDSRKEIYDFENSDSASHEKVAEAKGKILGQKFSSQSERNYEMGNKNEESNKLERKRRSSYRKHIFSESNNENTSTGQSEKSWILDSQKRSLPKSVDYTRKRPRVRSKLKVLPVSSASSGSDYKTKKRSSRRSAPKEMLRKKNLSNSKGDDIPTVDLSDETPSEELERDPLLLNASEKGNSGEEEKATQKFHEAPGKLAREEESFKRKDSDILSGTVIKKPKFSTLETINLSPVYKPRRVFDSVEKEEKTRTGQELEYGMDDNFFPNMIHEDFGDSGVVTAFESFVSQLKKLFWSRYKKMESSTQNTLRTSEKNVSALLNQIHECRLSKLETFHKIVVEELASLEKETQVLANMEKDAVEFWNTQLLKLSSFCNQQKQRIQSVDSALGETAKNFVSTIQDTTYEHPMKAVENNVFVVPSD
ncbi:synaptonemal complex protein 2-like [Heliangelus exortis]|uniref:synaptonemal complex protein 2-like n=1 Tax=Heliangelus exortis TaxID=472823 RepID=UPI003A958A5A